MRGARPGKPVRHTAAASRRTPYQLRQRATEVTGWHRGKRVRRAQHAAPLQKHLSDFRLA